MRGWWKLPALSGALLGLSYFPGPFLPLNFAAFIPMLVWLERQPAASGYTLLKAGFVFGLITHLTALHCMYSMLAQSWLAVLLYVGMAAALAVRISVSILLLGWLRRRSGPLSWCHRAQIGRLRFLRFPLDLSYRGDERRIGLDPQLRL